MARAMQVLGVLAVVVVASITITWTAGTNSTAVPDGGSASIPAADASPAVAEADDGRPTVTLFADSLGFEAAPTVADELGPLMRFDSSSMPGVALCDLIGALDRAPEKAPDVAVVQFSGNNLTPCMSGPDGQLLDEAAVVDKYAADVETVVTILRSRGSRVILAASPRTAHTDIAEEINTIYSWTAIGWSARGEPVTYLDTATQLLGPLRSFAARLPCLPDETAGQGCGPDGTIAVRSVDGTHFCPLDTGGKTTCPIWSSGAHRFGVALADAVRSSLSTKP